MATPPPAWPGKQESLFWGPPMTFFGIFWIFQNGATVQGPQMPLITLQNILEAANDNVCQCHHGSFDVDHGEDCQESWAPLRSSSKGWNSFWVLECFGAAGDWHMWDMSIWDTWISFAVNFFWAELRTPLLEVRKAGNLCWLYSMLSAHGPLASAYWNEGAC